MVSGRTLPHDADYFMVLDESFSEEAGNTMLTKGVRTRGKTSIEEVKRQMAPVGTRGRKSHKSIRRRTIQNAVQSIVNRHKIGVQYLSREHMALWLLSFGLPATILVSSRYRPCQRPWRASCTHPARMILVPTDLCGMTDTYLP